MLLLECLGVFFEMLATSLDGHAPAEKLAQTASYINQQLATIGYPAPFDFISGKDANRILACIYSLLQQKQAAISNIRKIHTLDMIFSKNMIGQWRKTMP